LKNILFCNKITELQMREFGPKTQERWEREGLVVGRVGFAAIRRVNIQNELEGRGSPYTRLAEAYYKEFTASVPHTRVSASDKAETEKRNDIANWAEHAPSIQAGYHATGSLLGFCAWAYTTYVKGQSRQADPEELRALLKDPANREPLLAWFADVPNGINRIRESYFGLRAGGYEFNRKYDENAFYVDEDPTTGRPRVQMSSELRFESVRTALLENQPEGEDYERCPAHGNLLPAIWDAMADNICDNLAYFEPEAMLEPIQAAPVQ
jgi:hypothetical protein